MARKALTVMRTKQNKTFEVLSMFRTCPNKLNCLKERRKTPKKNVISSEGRIKFQLLHLEIIIITQGRKTICNQQKLSLILKEFCFGGFT